MSNRAVHHSARFGKAVALPLTLARAFVTKRYETISFIHAHVKPHPWKRPVCAAMVCAFLIRLIVLLTQYKAIAAPTLNHGDFGAEMGWVARSLALHQGFSSPFLPSTGPTALMPPLFPYLLSVVFRITGVYTPASAFIALFLQTVFSVYTCVPVFLIARNLHTTRAGIWAAWAWALYPYSVYFCAAQVWDYSLTALLFASSVAVLLQLNQESSAKSWIAGGLLIGMAALSNPSILPASILLAILAVHFRRNLLQMHLIKLGMLLATVAVVLAPWSVRNANVLNVAVPVRDGFWLEMWAGNHGDTSVTNPGSAHPATNPVEMELFVRQGEKQYLSTKRDFALDWVRHHPIFFAKVTLRRTVRFWTGYWSLEPTYLDHEDFEIANIFFCSAITLLTCVGFVWLFDTHRRKAMRVASVFLVFPLPYYLTHASMDYREPMEPLVVVLVTFSVLPLTRMVRPWITRSVEAGMEKKQPIAM